MNDRLQEARPSSRRGHGVRKVEAAGAGFLALFGEDTKATFERLASAPLPQHAEVCLVDRLRDDGIWFEVERRAVAGVDPTSLEGLRCRFDPNEAFGAPRVGQRQSPLLLAHLGGELVEAGPYVSRLRELGYGSLIAVPLRAKGRLLGVMTLVGAAGGPPFDREDLAYAEALGAHGAMALHEAGLREELLLALRAREELLASVALDLRDPFATLTAFVHRFARRGGALSRDLFGVRRATLRIERMLADVAAAASLRSGLGLAHYEDERPSALLRGALEDVRLLLGDRLLDFDPPSREPLVRCDAQRVRHALGNLLGYAARATPPDGRLALDVRACNDEVVFSVHDGVSPAFEDDPSGARPKSAPPAREARESLPVAIARELVAAEGGRLWVERAARGNAFRVALPRG